MDYKYADLSEDDKWKFLNEWDLMEINSRINKNLEFKRIFNEFSRVMRNNNGDVDIQAVFEKLSLVYLKIFEMKRYEYLEEVNGDWMKRLEYRDNHKPLPKYVTKSGIKVRSKIEKMIADFYWDCGIEFRYEPKMRIGDVLINPDFYLPEFDIVHEHFGLESESYEKNKAGKMKLYEGMKFMFTEIGDETDIAKALAGKLWSLGIDLNSGF